MVSVLVVANAGGGGLPLLCGVVPLPGQWQAHWVVARRRRRRSLGWVARWQSAPWLFIYLFLYSLIACNLKVMAMVQKS
jgi:hypothetical protein